MSLCLLTCLRVSQGPPDPQPFQQQQAEGPHVMRWLRVVVQVVSQLVSQLGRFQPSCAPACTTNNGIKIATATISLTEFSLFTMIVSQEQVLSIQLTLS